MNRDDIRRSAEWAAATGRTPAEILEMMNVPVITAESLSAMGALDPWGSDTEYQEFLADLYASRRGQQVPGRGEGE